MAGLPRGSGEDARSRASALEHADYRLDLLGGVFGVILLVSRSAGSKTAVPFGPWMLGGAWVGILGGHEIAAWYLGLFGLGVS